MTIDLNDDPRWQRLHDNTWVCPCCGEAHGGLFDLALDVPEPWEGDEEPRPDTELRSSNNILTKNFCVLDGDSFFVRCVLKLPIIGSVDSSFGYGIWSSLSQTNFDLDFDDFDSESRADQGPWFGWFANRLQGYPDTLALKCRVHPQNNHLRPLIELEPTDHPLSLEQQHGITLDRILELYAETGHDMRDALSA